MIQAFVHFLRRSIARKLTVTLVGFVAVTMVVAGLYLNRALEAFALEQLGNALTQLQRSGVDHPCRDFFAADLKQKIWHQAIHLSLQNYASVNVSTVTTGVTFRLRAGATSCPSPS